MTPTGLVHLDGRLIPAPEARLSPFDRGFLFGDGVYEGLRSSGGRVIGLDLHIRRMREGLAEARITGFDPARLGPFTAALLEANALRDAFIYWQVTRGSPWRGPEGTPWRARIPSPGVPPTVFGFALPARPVEDFRAPEFPERKRIALRPDTRWLRGRLKSVSLLGGVLASIEAAEQGCDDAVMHRGGLITEGTATNVFLSVGAREGRERFVTPSLDSAPMLEGVTRRLLCDLDPSIEQRPVSVEDFLSADEIMLVGTNTMVVSVASVDGKPVGAAGLDGAAPRARALLDLLITAIEKDIHSSHG